jgi:hypothetical protein
MKILTVIALLNGAAMAESKNFYVGAGIAAEKNKSYLYSEDALAGMLLKVGYNLHKNIAVELRGSKTLGQEERLEHTYGYGLYLKPQYAVTDTWNIYGLVGYGQNKITFPKEALLTNPSITNNQSKVKGFSYGAGISYDISEDITMFIEAMQVIDESITKPEGSYAINVKGIYLGLTYHFGTNGYTKPLDKEIVGIKGKNAVKAESNIILID